jgi:S-adenosylmethionine:tRNA ribosyltransferase-isomerase
MLKTKLTDYDYSLPESLIARYPLAERSASRLLCLEPDGAIHHKKVSDIDELIQPNDLLILNNTKVIAARLLGKKATGGQVEVLVERILDDHRILAHVRASKSPKPGNLLFFENEICFEMVTRHNDLFELRCKESTPVLEIIEKIGQIPLPPYFHREPEESDKERYQTIFAKNKGSVAAPTAGLHFDETLFQKLKTKKIEIEFLTLHVGAGTFAPVRVDDIRNHHMHAEYAEVTEELCKKIRNTKARGGRVIAVGTTTARTLETASQSGEIKPFRGDTSIFIYPGFQFHCVDVLMTNFHLPQSTLLMLVAAFGGYENMMRAYKEAVENKYRFFSYGDAMWIGKQG